MRELDTPASDSYNQRFGGTRRLYGNSEVDILRAAHVCVIGIGGVGSWAVEALARTGIGELTLIDMDDVCVTNINRQIHAMTGTVGQSKIEVMAHKMRQTMEQPIIYDTTFRHRPLNDTVKTKSVIRPALIFGLAWSLFVVAVALLILARISK